MEIETDAQIQVRDGWWLRKQHLVYTAKKKGARVRVYFSRAALERDFGSISFPGEDKYELRRQERS